jgi:hypothetical protein
MKYNYTSDQIVGPLFKYNSNTITPDWLDYEKLWQWQESFFKRLNYSDGSNRSMAEEEKIKKAK